MAPWVHTHKFSTYGYRGAKALMRCSCGSQTERPSSAKEKRWFKETFDNSERVHKVWHAFQKRFFKAPGYNQWKYKGYQLMEAIERWVARTKPSDVYITHCGDEMFMNSSIVLIEHRAPRHYMGLTLIAVPQSGATPTQVFLYPKDRNALADLLCKSREESEPLIEAEANYAYGKKELLEKIDAEFNKKCLTKKSPKKTS